MSIHTCTISGLTTSDVEPSGEIRRSPTDSSSLGKNMSSCQISHSNIFFQNTHRDNSSEDTVELVDVNEVLRHLRGEDEVDDGLPDQLEGVAVEALEDVDAVVGERELEGQGRVVVLQDSDVVVEVGELGVGIA